MTLVSADDDSCAYINCSGVNSSATAARSTDAGTPGEKHGV